METNQRLEYVVSTLSRYRKLWIYPTVAGLIISAVYVFLIKSPTWTARQSLIIRDDLLGQSYKPGQFSSLESMKSAQETILEVARKPQVVRNALVQLGPAPSGWSTSNPKNWISDELIEDVQGAITFSAPNGAEFGKTEIIIVNTKGSSRERALRFNQFLLQEMDKKISEVRALRLQSMESELIQARDASWKSLDQSLMRLRQMESGLGADVSTMNGLNSAESGDGGVRREISEISKEKRLVEAELASALNTKEMLIAANLNPEKMLATSSEFLRTQPTLEALKKAYVTLQETKSRHNGHYTPEHPLLKSSTDAIWAMRQQMYQELETLTEQVNSHVRVLKTRIHDLDEYIDTEIQRLSTLGTKRVDHLTINAEVKKKTEILNQSQSELAEIQALRMASGKVEWLTRVDAPQVASRPDGMGKKATILAGATCGLMMGLGLVMLLAPPLEEPQRGRQGRRTDLSRRATDQRLETPSLDEMVGPTAAAAIQSASAATTATVNKGVKFAKHALAKTKVQNKGTVNVADSHRIEPTQAIDVAAPAVAKDATTRDEQVPTLAETTSTENGLTEAASISVTIPHLSATAGHDSLTESAAGSAAGEKTSGVGDGVSISDGFIVPAAPSATPEPVSGPPMELSPEQTAEMQSAPVDSQKLESVLASLDSADKNPKTSPTEIDPGNPGKSIEEPNDQQVASNSESKPGSAPGLNSISVESESVRSARTILEEIKAKTESKKKEASGAVVDRKIGLNVNPARVQRKTSNQRPIDLAKSVEEQTGKGPVNPSPIQPREDSQTQQIDNLMASIVVPDVPSVEPTPTAQQPLREFTENPFLENLPQSKPQPVGDSSTSQDADSSESVPAGGQTSTGANPNSDVPSETTRDHSTKTMPMSEQIKDISDSIAKYTKRQNLGPGNADSPDRF